MSTIFYEVTGFLGVALYLGSYAALQAGFVRGSSYTYAVLNLLAAGFVLASLFRDWNLWSAIIQISWIVLSIVGMTRVWLLTRALRFSAEEGDLISTKFPTLDRLSARRLLDIGTWSDAAEGDPMTAQNEPVRAVYFISKGGARVDVGGQEIARVGAGHFIGEMACLEQGPASASVLVDQPSRLFHIASDDLVRLLDRKPDLAPHVHFAFSGNTQAKLKSTNQAYSAALSQQ